MLSVFDLEAISAARLQDARVLYAARRFDGAYYWLAILSNWHSRPELQDIELV